MEQDNSAPSTQGFSEIFPIWFLRGIALCFILLTIRDWSLFIGFYEGAEFRFDTMSSYRRLAMCALAVLHPVAALGLWGLFSWGLVIWVFTVAVELLMYVIYPQLFGEADWLVAFHASSLAIFAGFCISRYILQKYRTRTAS